MLSNLLHVLLLKKCFYRIYKSIKNRQHYVVVYIKAIGVTTESVMVLLLFCTGLLKNISILRKVTNMNTFRTFKAKLFIFSSNLVVGLHVFYGFLFMLTMPFFLLQVYMYFKVALTTRLSRFGCML